jgi:glycosyltransferase involved in cell wall biosynthesis
VDTVDTRNANGAQERSGTDFRKRVGMVISELEVGGAERLVVSLSGRLRAYGYRTVIFSLASGGALSDAAAAAGAEVVPLAFRRADPRVVWALEDALRRHRVDVLHLHLPRAGVLGRFVGRRLALHPVVYTEHNVWHAYGLLVRRLNQWTMPWADHVVAVSDEVRRCMLAHGVPGERVTTIPNGIDVTTLAPPHGPALRGMLGLPPGTPVVGVVANLHPRKGLDTLVAALPHLLRVRPDARAVLIGRDDGEAATLRRLAARAGVGASLHLLGPRSDAVALMCQFDVFVLPSRVEGLPVALLEAMALERPVVVTPVGGVPEVVRDGKDGLHVPVDQPKALAEAIHLLLRSPEVAAALGRSAAARVRGEFGLERMVDAHARLYERLCAHDNARRTVAS